MDGQLSLFDGFITNVDEKPPIGTKVIFYYEGKNYPAVVTAHCGADYFYIEFTDRKPSDDNADIEKASGWHVSLRGYGTDWEYA